MKTSRVILSLSLSLPLIGGAVQQYEPTYDSLKQHETPEWLLDAKFGIWTHWTPVTYAIKDATEQMGWYAGNMYIDGSKEQKHHIKYYGPISEVGYGDLCKQFNPVNFNAADWAQLFADAGARFAGPTAIHHDNFVMFDSKLTPWNAMDMGPKRDIVGELERAMRARGMKYLLSYHHGYSWFYYRDVYKHEDPTKAKNVLLFGEDRPPDLHEKQKAPESFQKCWLALADEANGRYKPDVIWHDFGLQKNISPEYRDRFLAGYYNMGVQSGKEVEALIRDFELTRKVGMNTLEKGVRGYLDPIPWNKNTSISQEWFAFSPRNGVELLSLEDVIHDLVDTVSKNGTYILNVGPNSDGTIRPVYRERLLEIGRWLKTNGAAIYATRPWLAYGEFARGIPPWRYVGHVTPAYDGRDIRYTQSKDGKKVYAMALGWPEVGRLKLQVPKVMNQSPVAEVRLLGCEKPVAFQVEQDGKITLDLAGIDVAKLDLRSPAFAFEMRGFELGLAEDSARYSPNAIGLHPEAAACAGWGLRAQPDPRGMVLSRWITAEEAAHWQVNIRRGGTFEVFIRYSLRHENGFPMQFVQGEQVLDFNVEHTGADVIREVSLGEMTLENGFQELELRVAHGQRPSSHHLKVFDITLVPR